MASICSLGLLGSAGCAGTTHENASDAGPSTSTTLDAGDAGSTSSSAMDGGDAGCGTGGGKRGLTGASMTVAGLSRTYLVYLPPSVDPSKNVPLVYVHHGTAMSGEMMYEITRYTQLADSEGLAVAFPDGEMGPGSIAPWNVGTDVCGNGNLVSATGDDYSFLEAMHTAIEKDQCIDSQHVFVSGFSMGAYFAHQVACMRPDLARAVSAHSGGTHDLSTCVAGHKPIIIFHGDADPLIADGCDDPDASDIPSGFTPSATMWAKKNGCSDNVTIEPVENGHCEVYQGCPADGQVELCIFHGMGHCWAGGVADAGDSGSGTFACPAYERATNLQWNFFKQYAW
jgi:polyhydroxybutyrate depolymerase